MKKIVKIKRVLISIIIPIYNSERYLNKCLDSILLQKSNNIELILIDDGSWDNSCEICDMYANKYECVKTYHIKNGGVSHARNLGMKYATGEYIMFVDSDDELSSSALAEIEEIINKDRQNDVILYGFTVEKPNESYDVLPPNAILTREEFGEYYVELYQKFLINSPCNKVFCKRLFNEKTVFPEYMSLGEDLVFCNSYLRQCNQFYLLNNSLYKYKQREEDSLTTRYYSNLFELYCQHYWDVCNTISFFSPDWDRAKSSELYKMYYRYIKYAISGTASKNNKDSFGNKIKRIKAICRNNLTIECVSNLSKIGVYEYLIRRKWGTGILLYVKLWELKIILKIWGKK